ncbi:hypothetical protein CAPTEDRAFT_221339 [Capitella teleta]|uniref:nitric-oxide synthase (NADPH) n=1 Tax=Capitella teleta TaxID=283909 RepID=R7UUZ3_CAPTE|nr:hypothetical protein CAPTEDRAFT_221339 [Capitella teleta]|eukprot:ELU07757.1 hypothetical protein CAPTEDRAFT_221339 [Capitella teleta]
MKSPEEEEEEEEEAPDTSPNRKKPKFREIARAVKLSASLMNNALTKRVCCTILFATETGKSENFASQLAELFKHAFNPRVICMRDYDVNELEHEALVLIVGSTFGNGDPPDSGCEFANDLNEMQSSIGPERVKSEKRLNERRTQTVMHQLHVPSADHLDNCMLPLANVKFAVFGLGSRSYPNFCAFGKLMDRLFEGLGAERLLALGEGDELCGQENSFEEWSQQVYETSCDTFCLVQSSTDRAAAKARSVSDQKWTAKRYRLIPADGGASLCTSEDQRQTILCRLSLPPSGATEYSPGDHLALFPQNPHDIVDAILNKVVIDSGMTADDWFRLETLEETQSASGGIKQTWLDDKRLTTTTLRSALTHLLDITTPPAQSLLRQMAGLATEQKDREGLQHLAEATAEYEDWKHEFHPNLAEVLAQFPSLQLTATFLLTQLPLLLQRYYSISCCPAAYPGEVHATVAVIQFTTQDGKGEVHRGVSSSWLNEIAQQQIIPCYIRRPWVWKKDG